MKIAELFVLFAVVLAHSACAAEDPYPSDGRVFDACNVALRTPEGASATEREAIASAAELWNEAAGLKLELGPASEEHAVEVRFKSAAGLFRGFYDPESGLVLVNSRLIEARSRAVTIAHELGHAFGLPHVESSERISLMNPGNIVTGPMPEDVRALQDLWGDCSELQDSEFQED